MKRAVNFLATLAVGGLVLFFAGVVFVMNTDIFAGNAFPVDFAAFWAAANLTLEGRAVAAFDRETLHSMLVFPPDYPAKEFPWMYPPTWALVSTPLGLLPYWAAWTGYAFASLAFYLMAISRWAQALPGGVGLVVAAPVIWLGTINSNTAILLAALLTLALVEMQRDRPARAGLLIACLAIKPTVGLLLPIALAAGGRWRVFLWAALGTAVFALLATLVFGPDYWSAFLSALSRATTEMQVGGIPTEVMVTWYGFTRAVGIEHVTALTGQIVISIAVAGLTAWVWWRGGSLAEKSAVLLVAIPIATPYAHYYELTFALSGIVLWIWAGHGRRRDEQVAMALLWLCPALILVREPSLLPYVAAPLATTLLALFVARTRT